ncbi:MAG TPA: glycosyltransferase [Thermoanaerobaculia bacterium]|nr:glycosyltransferase [Thermoanaerobaculia bacterium]
MKVAVVAVAHPGARGGAEVLYEGVEQALARAGHEVERVTLPCDESTYEGILDGYRAARNLDLSRFDAVISTKAPSFNLRHPNHVVYLLHTVRVFYDMFDSWTDGSALSRSQRDRVRELDFSALAAVDDGRRFAIGEEVAGRLMDSLGLPTTVVHPPLPDAHQFREGPFEFFLHAGRLHAWKRVDLVIRAYLSLSTDVPLVITGRGEAEADLRRLAAGNDRIRFLGDVDRTALYGLYSRALAVPFVPVREDYGYVAIEAMLSGKPVITAFDAGEPARLVEDGVSGFVVAAEPPALAAALEKLARDPGDARRMGVEARARAIRISATDMAETLLGSMAQSGRVEPGVFVRHRPRVLIVDNQPIEPPIGGGRIRLFGLYSHLPSDLDPVYVGTYDWPGPGYRSVLHQGRLREITVPQSSAHFQVHEALRTADPTLTVDVTFPLLFSLSESFVERAVYEARKADVIVISHPWTFPVVARDPELAAKPLVYDAHNVEGRLRRSLLSKTSVAPGVARMVESLERELCGRAAAIFACSEQDAREFVEAYGVDADRVHVLPNGTDVDRLRPATPDERRAARQALGLPEQGAVAIFVGSDYAPNAEAARFLCVDLAPNLPDVHFLIVGGCSKDIAGSEIPGNVTVLGVVDGPTRDRALAAADFAVNPMSRGSGTNIKMLDFFAAGLPVVTTPVGARGLSAGVGRAYLVTELGEFPATIRGLTGSPARAARISRAARLLAESRYDWRQISGSAARILRQLVRESRKEPVFPRTAGEIEPRVAVMSTWKTHCGIADYADSLTRAFPRDRDWRVYAEARSCGVSEDGNVRRNWDIGLENLTRLERDLESDAPDVLLIQHNPAFFREEALRRLLALAREKGVASAITLHAVQGLRIDSALALELARTDRIYVHRAGDAEWLARLGPRSNVRVIPQGITRLPERSPEWVRKEIGLPGRFLIGHFGYLRPHKGVIELVEAFERIAASDPRADLLLLCAEYPSEDSRDYRKRCEARISRSPVASRIHASFDHLDFDTAGFLMQACDVLAFPYYPSGESSSAAVRLGIAAGRPIVVSDSKIFEELRDVVEVASSIEPEPLARAIREVAGEGVRSVAEARVRAFARTCEWSRVASLVWGDLRSLVREESRARGAA